MSNSHGGITLGSETGNSVQNVYACNLTIFNQFWATNSLNIATRIRINMNRSGFVKSFYVTNVSLPNGVSLTGTNYGSKILTGSSINGTASLGVVTPNVVDLSASQGGIITFDCDYQPTTDTTRTQPVLVQNVSISNVTAGNVITGDLVSPCFQAIVAQSPVVFDYNGPLPASVIPPVAGVMILNYNFGMPTAAGPASAITPEPLYAYNVHDTTLQNVVTAGQTFNTIVADAR